jgi:D-amino-acid dehydrogenase
MHAIVVGAGLTGLQTAFALHEQGAEVTLVEALSAPCQGASYSCAAMIGEREPELPAPASGGLARFRAHTSSTEGLLYSSGEALRHPGFVNALTALREEKAHAERAALAAKVAEHSSAMLRAIAERCGFELQESAGELTAVEKAEDGEKPVPLETLLPIEPSLYAAQGYAGFIVGRAATWSVSYYAKQLKEYLLERGVTILCGRKATGLLLADGHATGVAAGEPVRGDAVVVTAGLRDLVPADAYGSVPTAPVNRSLYNVELFASAHRVRHTLRDREGRTAAPLDAFLRLMGRWHLGDPDEETSEKEYKDLWNLGIRLFPEAADWRGGRYLTFSVLSSPDGMPIAGGTKIPGLFLNAAGGMHGADFCAPAADAAACAALGRECELGDALSYKRFA